MSVTEVEACLPAFLVRSSYYYIAVIGMDGRYLYVNPHFNNRYGFLCGNLVGEHSYIAVHPEDQGICQKAVEKCFSNPDEPVVVRLRKPDTGLDDFYWTEWEFSVFRDGLSSMQGILCVGVDVTETQKASKQALKFEAKVETILEDTTDGFYQLDRNWNFIKINSVAEKVLGMSRYQLLGHSIWELFPDTTGYTYPDRFREAMAENKRVIFNEYRPDLDRWFDTTCYPSSEGLTVFFKDNTQEVKSAARLRDSENKLRAILNSTSDSNILLSPEKRILVLNKAATSFLRAYLNRMPEIGEDFCQLFSGEDRQLIESNFGKALAGEPVQFLLPKQVGELTIWLSVKYNRVEDEEGNIMGVSLNFIDITAQKQAEERLTQETNKLRSILESTTDGHVLIGADFKVLSFNQVLQRDTQLMLNHTLEVGDDFRKLLDERTTAAFYDSFNRAMAGEVVAFEFEYKGEDQVTWLNVRYFPAYNERNEIFGVAYNYKNINSRKFAELKLRQSEAMLKTLYDSTNESVTFIDTEMRILFNNRLSKEITKAIFGKEAQVGDYSLQYYVPEIREEFVQHYQEVLTGKTIYIEKEYQGVWWAFSLYPVYDAEGKILGISDNVTDITARKQNELRIMQQNEKLKNIAWLQSHKVRRPLANVVGIYNVLKEDQTLTPEEKEYFLDTLLDEVKALDVILHEIVFQSREV